MTDVINNLRNSLPKAGGELFFVTFSNIAGQIKEIKLAADNLDDVEKRLNFWCYINQTGVKEIMNIVKL